MPQNKTEQDGMKQNETADIGCPVSIHSSQIRVLGSGSGSLPGNSSFV